MIRGRSPSPPRTVSGIAWHLDRMVIAQTVEASMMSGVLPQDHVPERTPAEYIAKAVKFDESASLFELALDPVHGRRWAAPMSVLHADGRVMRWHCWGGKGRTDTGNVGVRFLWHDVTDVAAPEVPTLRELGMQEVLRTAGGVHRRLRCRSGRARDVAARRPRPGLNGGTSRVATISSIPMTGMCWPTPSRCSGRSGPLLALRGHGCGPHRGGGPRNC